ncbi:hypothetical protein QTP70_032310, partial [Hemibagrus guttatus]
CGPKSVLCAFFKQGQCTKGDKCKFSHDLSLDRKCEKRSVYVDVREEELEKGNADTMENWDGRIWEEVVNKKHGEAEKKKAKTQIVRFSSGLGSPQGWVLLRAGYSSRGSPQGWVLLRGLSSGLGTPHGALLRAGYSSRGSPQGWVLLTGLSSGRGSPQEGVLLRAGFSSQGSPQGWVLLTGLSSGLGTPHGALLRTRFSSQGSPQGWVLFRAGYSSRGSPQGWVLLTGLSSWLGSPHGALLRTRFSSQGSPQGWVCKYFLEAIENNKYGWFWVCPAGGDGCMYRHALPVGFVLKKDKKKEENEEEEISLEELIENERAALGLNVTRITLETFLAWKKRKRQEKIAKAEQDMERKKADFKAGKALGLCAGEKCSSSGPELVNDDDEEADDPRYAEVDDEFIEQEEDEDEQCQDIDISRFVLKEVDDRGITVAAADRFTSRVQPSSETDDHKLSEASGGVENGEDHTLEEGGSTDSDEGGAGEEEAEPEAVPVDENLFTGEDLDELEGELNTLDLDE